MADDLARALRNLRHLYEQMVNGHVTNAAEAARGLLGSAIENVEHAHAQAEKLRAILGDAVKAIRECSFCFACGRNIETDDRGHREDCPAELAKEFGL